MVNTMDTKHLIHCLLWTAVAASTDVVARSSADLPGSATSSSSSLSSMESVNPLHPLDPRVAPQSVLQDIKPPPPCAVGIVSNIRPPLTHYISNDKTSSDMTDIRFFGLLLPRLTYALNL